ncbi:deoxycytidylate deaminase-like [Halictus rubicundus]|uniref:deoxycytidylate deaminase-like n=1 Tax=Halictus rubicundus TaxID=77578 RepID=UPI0040370AC8
MAENSGNIIDEHHYFMAAAFLIAKRSKDPVTKVGACIVDDEKKIVGVGYNGMPQGTEFSWNKSKVDPHDNKHSFVCHAELNAILFRSSTSLKGCTVYTTLFPCNGCAKAIVQAGITKVMYMSDKHSLKDETKAAKKIFTDAHIECSQFEPEKDQIRIDFTQN